MLREERGEKWYRTPGDIVKHHRYFGEREKQTGDLVVVLCSIVLKLRSAARGS